MGNNIFSGVRITSHYIDLVPVGCGDHSNGIITPSSFRHPRRFLGNSLG